ncbi:zinc finger protein 37 homolog [Armigeres subalbatus]|uniref:zinc finger protein 37 homolog n=1 Tax=Armigeres subalbatus TaxID=124917 RepID=UPI002ED5B3AE
MNESNPIIMYSYAVADQIYELKSVPDQVNGQNASVLAPTLLPTNIVQLVPGNVTVRTNNASSTIRVVENIQLQPPTREIHKKIETDLETNSCVKTLDHVLVPDIVQEDTHILPIIESDKIIELHGDLPQEVCFSLKEKSPPKKAFDELKSTRNKKPVASDVPPRVNPKSFGSKSRKKNFIYECDVCDSRFLSATSLILHKTGHRYGPPEEKKSWICRFCGRHFSHQQTLGDHEKVHTDEVRYNCGACGAKYNSKSGLRNHLAKNGACHDNFRERKLLRKKEEEDEKSHECEVCGKKYRHRKSMVEHRSLHYRSKQHRCEKCGAMFETTGGWRKHVANGRCEFSKCKFKGHGTEEGGVFIPEERKKFLDQVEEVKKRQMEQQSDRLENSSSSDDEDDQDIDSTVDTERQVKEPVDTFTAEDQNNDHLENEENVYLETPVLGSPEIKEENLSCDEEESNIDDAISRETTDVVTDTVLDDKNQLQLLNSTSQVPRPRKQRSPKVHQCPTCKKVFARSFVLKTHLRTHTGERPFLCDTCSKSFSDSASLKAHIVVHTGEKPFPCPECPARFARKSGLRNHITVHFNLSCDQCDQKFPSRKTLMRHKIKHQGIRPFLCEICSKDFRTKADMQAHMRIHTNEKRYTCPICSARFNCPSTLRRHRNVHAPPETRPVCTTCGHSFSSQQALRKHENIHNNVKPFRCDVCAKSFRVKDHLKIHFRSHSGEKPFPCEVCQKRFVTNGDLKVHMRRHTGEKPFSCEVCGEAFVVTATLYRHIRKTGHRNRKPEAIIVQDVVRAT